MKNLLSKIPKEIRSLVLLLIGVVFVMYVFVPPSPPAYKDAQKLIHQKIQQHCKEMHYDPCDYQLVKVLRDNSVDGSGIYLFESKYRKPISVNVDGDGIGLLDNSLYSLEKNKDEN